MTDHYLPSLDGLVTVDGCEAYRKDNTGLQKSLVVSGSCQARSKSLRRLEGAGLKTMSLTIGACPVGVRGFKSHLPHHLTQRQCSINSLVQNQWAAPRDNTRKSFPHVRGGISKTPLPFALLKLESFYSIRVYQFCVYLGPDQNVNLRRRVLLVLDKNCCKPISSGRIRFHTPTSS